MDQMNRSFHEYLDTCIVVFIDYIFVYPKDEKEHEKHQRLVLDVLHKQKWFAKLSKCELWLKEVAFLGHVINKEGVKMDPAKIKVVVEQDSPKNVTEDRSFLGLAGGYYQVLFLNPLPFPTFGTPSTKSCLNLLCFWEFGSQVVSYVGDYWYLL